MELDQDGDFFQGSEYYLRAKKPLWMLCYAMFAIEFQDQRRNNQDLRIRRSADYFNTGALLSDMQLALQNPVKWTHKCVRGAAGFARELF